MLDAGNGKHHYSVYEYRDADKLRCGKRKQETTICVASEIFQHETQYRVDDEV